MRFRGFNGPSYTLASVNADCQRCVNLYPEVNELGTGPEQEVTSLVSTPGLRLLCDLGGPIRGTLRLHAQRLPLGVPGGPRPPHGRIPTPYVWMSWD